MSMRDLMNDIHPVVAVAPQILTDDSSVVSAVIDTLGYSSLTLVVQLGTLADSDGEWTVTVKSGDTATQGDHTAVVDDFLIGTEALAGFTFENDGECRKIGYKGSDRYVSIEIDNSGAVNSGNAPIAVLAVLGDPVSRPTSNPPA